jgi:hypothetical protein
MQSYAIAILALLFSSAYVAAAATQSAIAIQHTAKEATIVSSNVG